MLSRLRGTILALHDQAVELFADPFTFYVMTPTLNGFNISDVVDLFTHLIVKEDGISIFGFINATDKNIFLQLIKVRSIGPKLAFQIMQSDMSVFIDACQRQDKTVLCTIPGIGLKTAARILAEIDVNSLPIITQQNNCYRQAKQMLLNLGFAESMIDAVLPNCPQDSLNELVKTALKQLGDRRARATLTN
jgi:holliday junction DNA helicase RuvA